MHHSRTHKPLNTTRWKTGIVYPKPVLRCYLLGFQGALPKKEQLKSTTSVFLQSIMVIVLAVPNLKAVFFNVDVDKHCYMYIVVH